MVSGGGGAGLFKRLIGFCTSPSTWLISAALVIGTFIALQSKLPVDLKSYEIAMDQGADNIRRFGFDTPIESYGGPVVLVLEYSAPSAGCELILPKQGSSDPFRHVPLQPGRAGKVKLLFYRGEFPAGGAFNVLFSAEEPLAAGLEISAARLELPRAGFWLHPNPLLWGALVIFGVALGLAATLLWSNRTAATACFLTTASAEVLAIHFLGIGFASMLAAMLPGALVLVVAVFIFRHFLPEQAK